MLYFLSPELQASTTNAAFGDSDFLVMIKMLYRIVALGIIAIPLLGEVPLATNLKAHDKHHSSGADIESDGDGVYKVHGFRVASTNG